MLEKIVKNIKADPDIDRLLNAALEAANNNPYFRFIEVRIGGDRITDYVSGKEHSDDCIDVFFLAHYIIAPSNNLIGYKYQFVNECIVKALGSTEVKAKRTSAQQFTRHTWRSSTNASAWRFELTPKFRAIYFFDNLQNIILPYSLNEVFYDGDKLFGEGLNNFYLGIDTVRETNLFQEIIDVAKYLGKGVSAKQDYMMFLAQKIAKLKLDDVTRKRYHKRVLQGIKEIVRAYPDCIGCLDPKMLVAINSLSE